MTCRSGFFSRALINGLRRRKYFDITRLSWPRIVSRGMAVNPKTNYNLYIYWRMRERLKMPRAFVLIGNAE